MTRHVIGLFGALWLLGCDDPLAYPQDIERLRVLGARASVEGDASRAWPEPGEAVSLELLVAAPDPSPSLGWRFEACPSRAAARGTPECAGAVFASAQAGAASTDAPRFDFSLPTDAEDRVLVSGLVCRDAVVTSLAQSCASEHERVIFELVVADAAHQNTNPTLSDVPLRLGGAPWPVAAASELADPDCAATPSALQAAPGEELELGLELAPSDRDAVEDGSELTPPHEPLLISSFATHGRLSRPLSVIEGDASDLSVTLSWRAPDDAAGERARFYFVVRDGRGGVDWSARTVCLAP